MVEFLILVAIKWIILHTYIPVQPLVCWLKYKLDITIYKQTRNTKQQASYAIKFNRYQLPLPRYYL